MDREARLTEIRDCLEALHLTVLRKCGVLAIFPRLADTDLADGMKRSAQSAADGVGLFSCSLDSDAPASRSEMLCQALGET